MTALSLSSFWMHKISYSTMKTKTHTTAWTVRRRAKTSKGMPYETAPLMPTSNPMTATDTPTNIRSIILFSMERSAVLSIFLQKMR